MRFRVLACDYDNTLATHGAMDPETVSALEEVRRSGRQVVLVTGRLLDELQEICDHIEVFDRVVAENGGLIWDPGTDRSRLLGPIIPADFVQSLRRHGVSPLQVGRVIASTWETQEAAVVHTIHEMGLDLQIIFNKRSVMILPTDVNKATGLKTALRELGTTTSATVAVGDAENDLVFLKAAGCGVAVGNALDSVKECADLVMRGVAGAGVRELIGDLLRDDLASALRATAAKAG